MLRKLHYSSRSAARSTVGIAGPLIHFQLCRSHDSAAVSVFSVWTEEHRPQWMSFYPRDAMLARVIEIATCLSVRLSVCPSVRHAPVLCQNEES